MFKQYFFIAYTKMANNLERAFGKYFTKEFPEEELSSDEDYVEEDDNSRKRKRGNKMKGNERNNGKIVKMNGKFCNRFMASVRSAVLRIEKV